MIGRVGLLRRPARAKCFLTVTLGIDPINGEPELAVDEPWSAYRKCRVTQARLVRPPMALGLAPAGLSSGARLDTSQRCIVLGI